MRTKLRRVQRFQPFQQQRQEDAALVRTEGVDLIDDAVRDAAQRLARLRRQQQVQRFGRRDQDVRRPAQQPLPLGGRRVAGADGDVDAPAAATPSFAAAAATPSSGTCRLRWMSLLSALSGEMYRTRTPRSRRVLPPQMIEAGEEGGERLAGAGRGEDERVLARRDGRPALALRRRRLAQSGRGTTPAPAAETGRAGHGEPSSRQVMSFTKKSISTLLFYQERSGKML